jgi:hypothetical protein
MEESSRNVPARKAEPTREAENLTTIRKPPLWTMWKPGHLTTLRASTAVTGMQLALSPLMHQ